MEISLRSPAAQDPGSRVWRKVKNDREAWNARLREDIGRHVPLPYALVARWELVRAPPFLRFLSHGGAFWSCVTSRLRLNCLYAIQTSSLYGKRPLSKVRDQRNRGSRLRAAQAPVPRHSVRATRTAGQKMRSRLLDAASALFKAHGLNGTSMTAIAGASDAFPSQVTYYFRTKEALFVEAACRDMLHIAEDVEKAAARARTPKAYASAVVNNLVGADGLILFVEALILARRRPDLVPQIARTIERLHVEGARAYAGEMARHGWRTHLVPDVTVRRFWALALGIALEGHAMGRSAAAMSETMREALGELAETLSVDSPAAAPKLHVVTTSRPSTKST